MAVEPKNLIVIMSDEHSAKMLGCYGHLIVALVHLAAGGRDSPKPPIAMR